MSRGLVENGKLISGGGGGHLIGTYEYGQEIQVKNCSRHVCTSSKDFRVHLLLNGMLPNLATMLASNSTHLGNNGGRNMCKSLVPIVTSSSLAAKRSLNQGRNS